MAPLQSLGSVRNTNECGPPTPNADWGRRGQVDCKEARVEQIVAAAEALGRKHNVPGRGARAAGPGGATKRPC